MKNVLKTEHNRMTGQILRCLEGVVARVVNAQTFMRELKLV